MVNKKGNNKKLKTINKKKNKARKSALNKSNGNLKCNKNVVLVGSSKKNKIKRINYTPEELHHALEATNNGLSLRKAALAYGIPVTTLMRKKNNDSCSKVGPSTVFTDAEEEQIANWIIYRADRGFPVSKTELLDCVQKYVQNLKKSTPFVDNRPGRHWYEAFRKRHPQLTSRSVQHLSLRRAAVGREDLQDWFKEIENYLKNKDLINISPDRVFNCDETSILLCPDSDTVLTRKGTRAVYKITDDNKESLTALFTYSAAGVRAPPMLLFSYKEKVPKVIVENTPKHWGIGISDNGWMTGETFFEFMTNVFYPWLLRENIKFPVILYLDNHSSHINIPLVQFCREKQIELIGLYPNSTHILQPLDIAFFHPFKETWKKTVPKWKNKTNCTQLKKENFPIVLKMALDSMKEEKTIIIYGFRAAGLMPFDSSAVDYDILKKTRSKKTSIDVNLSEKENNVPTGNGQDFVQRFENNISAELLQQFKEALEIGVWTGNVEQKGLFEYWLQISNKSIGI